MTRYYYEDVKFLDALKKFVPVQKVERCPIPQLSYVYEIHGRALARRKHRNINLSGHPLQERSDRAIESVVIEDENGEPYIGKSCIFYGGDGKEALWCK